MMKRYYFSGIVHPERAQISLEAPPLRIMTADAQPFLEVRYNIYNNQISAMVDCARDGTDLFTLRNHIRAHVGTAVTILGFILGRAYDIEITKVFDESLDETLIFGIDIKMLEQRNKHLDVNLAANHIINLCSGPDGRYIRRCLDDLTMSIRYLDDSAFYCYRAIESIKQYFGAKNNLLDDAKKWRAFADAIGAVPEELNEIKALADPSRHGTPVEISDEARGIVFSKTWDIVEKFIDYRSQELGLGFRLRR